MPKNFIRDHIGRGRLMLCCLIMCCPSIAFAQGNRGWTDEEGDPDFPGKTVSTKTLVLHPVNEPRPSLRYRLLPTPFAQKEGNAAIHYLRAIGFPEQNNARKEVERIIEEANKVATQTGVDINQLPPYSWQEMLPAELPVEEVGKYLQLTEFQTREIAAAFKLKNLDFNRQLREVENPISILLLEVQMMRELARTQSLRCRLAIAEGKIEEAFAILGQQTRLATHLNQEPLLVTNLVGASIFSMNWSDALEFAQHPDAPNLYWALAALPRPLMPLEHCFSFEQKWTSLELKELEEVDENHKPAGYWEVFIDRILPRYDQLQILSNNHSMNRQDLVHLIAVGYPGAKRYLIEEEKMDRDLVESYTTAQTFFLAQKKYTEFATEDWMKWSYLDLHTMLADPRYQQIDQKMNQRANQFGVITNPVHLLLPAVTQVRQSTARTDLQIAMLMAVEGIRLYASRNPGQLPENLGQLPYPLPADPFTGQPLQYEKSGNVATLTGKTGQQVLKLNLQLAKSQ
jgi:hypothetical protein